jgi:hypothetical protein
MPKLDDYDDSGAFAPLTSGAQASIVSKIQNGGFASASSVTIDYAASVKATADAAAVTTAGGAESIVVNDNTDWINRKWRPMMGWTYMVTCMFDFVIAPILWSVIQALGNGGKVELQWQPLTLQGAGLYHLAMGAVLGVAAYGRTKEKIESKV